LTFTIIARKYDGTIHRSWNADLVSRRGPLLVFLGKFEREVVHPDLGVIAEGTASYEYYWLDRCYNVFRFEHPGGGLRNYYCNVNLPPEVSDNVLDYVDLDIDVLVDEHGTIRVLDNEEFLSNADRMGYGEDVIETANSALEELLSLIHSGAFPFDTAE